MLVICIPAPGYATLVPNDLLKTVAPNEPFSKSLLKATKAVRFNKTSGDATEVSKITLTYFTSTDCGGSASGTYTTPSASPTFAISNNTPFGLVVSSMWDAGADADKANIGSGSMSGINSVAVILKSTDNNTPQGNFTGSTCGTNPSFCCVPVDCSTNDECTANGLAGNQDFILSTTTAIGDPADGGVIACKNTGISPNLHDLVVPAADNSSGILWGPESVATSATSATDGATNTATIVACLTGP